MGLDITAYRKITKIHAHINDDGEAIELITHRPVTRCFRAYVNPHFPGREDGLEDRAVYAYEDAEDVFSRSYSGYNRWREALAKLAGYPLTSTTEPDSPRMLHAAACWHGATGPFSELIDFADNEGVIGPVTAAKLARDFAAFDENALATDDEDFYRTFVRMRRGMEIAADDGALKYS